MRQQAIEGMKGMIFGSSSGMSAVDLLKEDHRKVKELFSQFEESRNKRQRMKLLNQIIEELTVHATLEEKHVYPLLESEGDTTKEAYEEHHVVKLMLAELRRSDGSEENLKAKVKVLSEMVEHHVEEEEGELLPKLQESGDMMQLGEKLQEEKRKLKARSTRSKTVTKTSARSSTKKKTSRGRRAA